MVCSGAQFGSATGSLPRGYRARYDRHVRLASEHRRILRDVARRTIEHGLSGTELAIAAAAYPEPLREPRATFVTLRWRGELLGCIGTLRALRPLVCDVAHNAHHAAFSDLRFEPLRAERLPELDVHISILSELEPLPFASEADLVAQLRVGIDGLVITHAGHSATFLPAMWDRLPDPREFLAALKEKAGWPADFWSSEIEAARYTVEDL
jgi:AmmeMemoRadiSam system protein A